MSDDVQSSQPGAIRPDPATVLSIRHGAFCAFWGVFLLASLSPFILVSVPSEARLVALIPAAYAVQGLLVELLGIRVGPDYITVPRRWGPLTPLLLLWRRRFAILGIKSILAKPKSIWGEQIVLQPMSGGRQVALFPSREQKLAFFRAVEDRNSFVSIYRAE